MGNSSSSDIENAFQDFGNIMEHTFEDFGNQMDDGFQDFGSIMEHTFEDVGNQIDTGFNNKIIDPIVDTVIPNINIGIDHIKDPVSIENTYKEIGNLIGNNIDKNALQKSVGYNFIFVEL